MYRPAFAFSGLLLCWNCHAACEVTASSDKTISVTVESRGCFGTGEQKQAFATQLKQAVQSMESKTSKSTERKSTAEQLNGFGDLKRQAKHLAPTPPVYYGQR